MIQAISNGIKYADTLSSSPNLKVENKDAYQTITGGLISISLCFLSIIGIFYFGQDLWNKNKPNAVVSAIDNTMVGPFEVNEEIFNIYVAVEYANLSYYVDPTIYFFNATIEINQFFTNGSSTYTIIPLEMDLCNKYYSNSSEISFDSTNIPIDIFYCVKPNVTYIQGYWGQPYTRMLHINLFKCQNTTENNNHCQPQELIDQTIQGGLLSTFLINNELDSSNYDVPVKKTLQNVYNSLNNELTFQYYFHLENNFFITDVGIFLQDFQTIQYSYFDLPLTFYYGQRGPLVCDIYIEGNKPGSSVLRTYTKIQDVVTKIGGMLKAISLIGQAIAYISSKFEFISDFLFNINYRIHNNQKSRSVSKEVTQNKMVNNFIGKDIIANNDDNSGRFSASKLVDNKAIFDSKLAMNSKNKVKENHNSLNDSNDRFKEEKSSAISITNIGHLPIYQTNILYSKSNICSDFFNQLFFPCKCNKRKINQGNNLQDKINKVLSIDYLLKKFFLLEIISKIVIEKKVNSLDLDQLYLNKLIEESNINSQNAFSISNDSMEKFGI